MASDDMDDSANLKFDIDEASDGEQVAEETSAHDAQDDAMSSGERNDDDGSQNGDEPELDPEDLGDADLYNISNEPEAAENDLDDMTGDHGVGVADDFALVQHNSGEYEVDFDDHDDLEAGADSFDPPFSERMQAENKTKAESGRSSSRDGSLGATSDDDHRGHHDDQKETDRTPSDNADDDSRDQNGAPESPRALQETVGTAAAKDADAVPGSVPIDLSGKGLLKRPTSVIKRPTPLPGGGLLPTPNIPPVNLTMPNLEPPLLPLFRKNLPTRYFIIKSFNHGDVAISIERGIWATQARNEGKLNEAFAKANVIMIFSVNESRHFQGYALMQSSISKEQSSVWTQDGGAPKSWGGVFKVKWLGIFDLPFGDTLHLRNPWNENKPVKISRDGQELPTDLGAKLCQMIDDGAGTDGHKRKIHALPAPEENHALRKRPRMEMQQQFQRNDFGRAQTHPQIPAQPFGVTPFGAPPRRGGPGGPINAQRHHPHPMMQQRMQPPAQYRPPSPRVERYPAQMPVYPQAPPMPTSNSSAGRRRAPSPPAPPPVQSSSRRRKSRSPSPSPKYSRSRTRSRSPQRSSHHRSSKSGYHSSSSRRQDSRSDRRRASSPRSPSRSPPKKSSSKRGKSDRSSTPPPDILSMTYEDYLAARGEEKPKRSSNSSSRDYPSSASAMSRGAVPMYGTPAQWAGSAAMPSGSYGYEMDPYSAAYLMWSRGHAPESMMYAAAQGYGASADTSRRR